MKILIAVAAILWSGLLTAPAFAEGEESQPGRRYLNNVFDKYQRTANIVYAEHLNSATGKSEPLALRLYEPKGDKEAKRVLFILTPGGGFVKHGDNWMDTFGEQLARAGYVVAINRYRLSDSINSAQTYMDALFKAAADQKAVIRFFVKDAQGENRFRIDPNNIFIGGHSAGAITSMHVAYIDSQDELVAAMKQGMTANGGLDGNNGKENVPFSIRGVINLSGLVSDLNIVDKGEPALLSMHGDKDTVVRIGSTGAGVHGSIPIHERAAAVGLINELHVIRGALHNDTADPELCPECVPLAKRFMFETMVRDVIKTP